LSSSGAELTRLLYKQLIKKVEDLLNNPKTSPDELLGLRNEVYSYLNSDLPDPSMQAMLQKYNAVLSLHNSPHLFVKGTVIINSGISQNNYKGVNITVTDKQTKQTFAIKPNPTTGKYLLILERNKKYSITATNLGYQTYSEEISPSTKKDVFEINQEIRMKE
jgi:hypothetical protein